MKKTLKVIALALAVATMTLAMAACGGNKKGDKLVFGTNAEFPPFEFISAKGVIGEFDGIDMAIADTIAKEN